MVKRYRKKPVEIEAIQFLGNNWEEIREWMKKYKSGRKIEVIIDEYGKVKGIVIETLEGKMEAKIGDYIVKGIKNEFYPVRKDIFEETYEEIEENGRVKVGDYIVSKKDGLHSAKKDIFEETYEEVEEG